MKNNQEARGAEPKAVSSVAASLYLSFSSFSSCLVTLMQWGLNMRVDDVAGNICASSLCPGDTRTSTSGGRL